jgi:phosphatidylglycerol:prolipoprotein diacylglycerol transferase
MNMTEVVFNIGNFAVGWYSIIIAIGVLLAIGVSIIETKRRGESTRHIINMALLVIPLGAIGARLYHVIDQ